ncbi:hypothetical protein QQS21_011862 [Conoideocrella luteorostrata]|uniref:Rhodopsin domain-containing protein n=1 Tax=Conoideocrella luteorostrata TaxID=1105319 RepID=A0AAJ0CCJ0_9HYPO|nr:hypothetical protein QQS21_011862 [Conoideocrella luteorostrata]
MDMTTDVDQAIAAGRVSEPLSREFLLESKDRPAIAGILFVTILTSVIVFGRVLSRTFIVRRFGYDDALAVVSLACLIAFVGLCIELITLGSGRHFAYIQYVLPVDIVMRTQILDFVAHIVYTTALLLCRVSGLAFYYRICGLHRGFLVTIRAVGGVIIAGFLPQLFLLIFHCHPVTGLWPYGWEPGHENYTCLQWGIVYSVNSSVSLVCDLLLFGIPVAMLWILEMPRKRKVQLGCILLPGLGVVGISVARLVLVIQGQWETDMSWSYNPMLAVETSEIGATLIALSIPGVKPIFDKYILNKNPHTESGNSKYNRSTSRRSKGTALSTLRLRSRHSMLTSQENAAVYGHEASASSQREENNRESGGEDGIFVRVDFDLKEEAQLEMGERKPGSKYAPY